MVLRYIVFLLAVVVIDEGFGLAADGLPRIEPTAPEQAAAKFEVQHGFRLELIAAEPLVTDPVAMAYDENGRAYVVEMNDYPYTDPELDVAWAEQESEAIGRVRLLYDDDGDGVFDRSSVFAEGLSWPTGVACWKGGVFVTATPDIWYLKDTDGDGASDERRKVFTGFRKYNVQAVINNLQWGLDHRVYAAGSSNGGQIQPGESLDAMAVLLGRNDFRFDPVSGEFEAISGGARFGNCFDDWGNRFICNIRNPVQHIVLEDRYLARNPSLAVASAVHDSADSGDAVPVYRISPPEPWRELNAARLAAENRTGTPRSEMHATGFVTSAAGVTIYRGDAYPAEFYGDAFVGEVAGNLVIRYRMEPDGATFRAVREEAPPEFLASTDNWFRPVNFVNAPDGTLHLLDMYRETIEHPWSIPDDIKALVDLQSGRDRGRIYRLVPAVTREGFVPQPAPRLGEAPIGELVATLENPNGWWRDTAHRLIYERQDAAAVNPLRALLIGSESPVARLHALYSLDGLQSLESADILAALADSSPRMREHGIRFAERHLQKDAVARDVRSQATSRIRELLDDTDARVRLQAALSLETRDDGDALAALTGLLRRDADDPWIRTAVLSSLDENATTELLMSVLGDAGWMAAPAGLDLCTTLINQSAARLTPEQSGAMLSLICQREGLLDDGSIDFDSQPFLLLLTVAERYDASGRTPQEIATAADARTAEILARVTESAETAAVSTEAELEHRVAAIRWLGCQGYEVAGPVLVELLDISQPQEVQSATTSVLSRFRDPRVAAALLERYGRLTPALREQVIIVLLARTDRLDALLTAIEKGEVPPGDIPPVRRTLLLKSGDAAVRERVQRLFGSEATPAEKRAVIERYRDVLTGSPDLDRGRAVFRRECATCHRAGGEGHDVGPALATIRSRTPAEVLEHILDPNREVSPHYLEYVVVTLDGLVKTGAIASETPTSITLRQPEGKQETVLRQDIDTISSSGKSLMPEGLEQKVTPEEMADLIGFLLEDVGAGP